MYFLEAKNPCFEMKNCSKSSYMCVFISPKKNSTIDFTKTFITKEWLVVESCPTPCWIALLMLYRLVYNMRSHFNELILAWSGYFRSIMQNVNEKFIKKKDYLKNAMKIHSTICNLVACILFSRTIVYYDNINSLSLLLI